MISPPANPGNMIGPAKGSLSLGDAPAYGWDNGKLKPWAAKNARAAIDRARSNSRYASAYDDIEGGGAVAGPGYPIVATPSPEITPGGPGMPGYELRPGPDMVAGGPGMPGYDLRGTPAMSSANMSVPFTSPGMSSGMVGGTSAKMRRPEIGAGSVSMSSLNADPLAGQSAKDKLAEAIMNNPAVLEDHWRKNPGDLHKAYQDNPHAFNDANADEPLGDMSDYNSFIDASMANAMRTLNPYISQDEQRFEQAMINRGLSPGTEAYNVALDQMKRGHNDLLNDAAFESMGFGASRMDADRAHDLRGRAFDASRLDADRSFGLNEFGVMDDINRAWDAINFRNASYNDSRRDHQFNQIASLLGLAPAGNFNGYNMGGAFQNANDVDRYNHYQNQQMWGDIGGAVGDAASEVDWGAAWDKLKGIFA